MGSSAEELTRHYLSLPDDVLLSTIAGEVVAGAGPLDDESKRFFGRTWFNAQTERLRARICGAQQQITDPNDRLVAALALLDVFTAELGTAHLPALVASAVLVTRVGLEHFCSE